MSSDPRILIATAVTWERRRSARVLAASVAEHHPEAEVTAMVTDARGRDLERLSGEREGDGEPQWCTAHQACGLRTEALHRLALCLEPDALTAALVPHLLRRLLAGATGEAPAALLFLSAATWVRGSLDPLLDQARTHGVTLLPRTRRPPEDDGRDPTAAAIRQAGLWDDGVLALSPSPAAETLLQRWAEASDPFRGASGGTPPLDAAVGTPAAPALTHPAFNLSRGNLHERALRRTGEESWEVDGEPLVAMCLPGFDPHCPYLLAGKTDPNPRFLLSEHPDLAALCLAYARAWEAAGDPEEDGPEGGGGFVPAFALTAGGLEVDPRIRRLALSHAAEVARRHELELTGHAVGPGPEPIPDPFDEERPERFTRWLIAPGSRTGIPRYLEEVYAERPDLQATFPDLAGSRRESFLTWVADHGTFEPPIPPSILRAARTRPDEPDAEPRVPVVPADEIRPGVNVVGYLKAESGVGEVARSAVAVLEAAKIPYSVILFDETRSRQDHPFSRDAPDRPLYDTNLFCINADQLPVFHRHAGEALFAHRTNIGLWAWEVEVLPEPMRASGDLLHQVWGISEHTARCVEPFVQASVRAFPLPVRAGREAASGEHEALPEDLLPGGDRLFLFCFDYDSVFERKNPLALVEAFRRAFPEPETGEDRGPRLLIKTINGHLHLPELEALRAAAAGRPDIRVVDRYLSAGQQRALMRACDVYVSLHRAEGFGLTLAEAMALGKPTIATAYSANLDFMTEENSYLVPYERVPVGRDAGPYPPEARWAEPSLETASALLRRAYDDSEEAAARGKKARQDILDDHSPAAREPLFRELLADARKAAEERSKKETSAASGGAHGASTLPWGGAGDIEALLQRGPELDGSSSFGAPARWLRRGVQRLIRAYDLHVQEVFRAVGSALQGVEARTERRIGAVEGSRQALESRFRELALAVGEAEARLTSVESASEDESYQRGLAYRRTTDLERRQRRVEEAIRLPRKADGDLPTVSEVFGQFRVQIEEVQRRLEVHSDEMFAVPYSSDPERLETRDPAGRETLGYRNQPALPREHRYIAFEEQFRGPEAFIRERQRIYLSYLTGSRTVVDLGCGRGEMLELLREAGTPGVGVDQDAGMVLHCQAKGLEAVHAEGVAYLSSLEDRSLGGIFCSQVVEHLTQTQMMEFLELAHAKLDTGPLIFETVNPHSLRAFKAFWLDPTHVRPIFPETAIMLCRFHAFESAFVLFPNGTGSWSDDRKTQGEYAVVAYPRRSPEPPELEA